MMFSLQDMVNWLAGCLMRRNLSRDTVKRWDLLPVVCHGKGKMLLLKPGMPAQNLEHQLGKMLL